MQQPSKQQSWVNPVVIGGGGHFPEAACAQMECSASRGFKKMATTTDNNRIHPALLLTGLLHHLTGERDPAYCASSAATPLPPHLCHCTSAATGDRIAAPFGGKKRDSMSSAMTRLFRVPRLAQLVSRRGMSSSQVANAGVKPVESIIGLTTFMIVFLVPSGYILSHLEEYKKRD
ncbi:unnamed protein product [Ranitomeya imitator]|uniref:Uncharacterized protein n=2 Tax=Ranitomeya imitator TaxID=111125 RepID=A0ABN9LWM6_9NEOB|nr:unnamed protein product [Ranitomeya imitator]